MFVPALFTSCAGMQPIMGTVEGEDLVLPAGSFANKDGSPKKYVVATHAQLKQPIVVFRDERGGYRAVLMRCTHKGAELRVTGDRLDCSAHGSAFDSHGAVLEGPASSPLRVFPTVERDGRVFISLKA
jgi:nitrite reductase/ring-hydroxylating ferredoxin subunit